MSVTRKLRVFVGVLFLAAVAGLILLTMLLLNAQSQNDALQVRIQDTEAALQNTEADLEATQETLARTQLALTNTKATLESTEATLESTKATLATTEGILASTQSDLEQSVRRETALQLDNATLETDLTETQGSLQAALLDNAEQQVSLDRADVRIESLMDQNEGLTTDKAQLQEDLETVEINYQMLEEAAGTQAQLEDEAEELRTAIETLHDERAPLIIESQFSYLACTASMEPNMTCLDTATWLVNFRPEDVVVGATITFTPDCSEDEPRESGGTAHRVLEIKQEGEIYYFWPRGDGNPEPDGCWIPHTHVRGYLLELHKNTRPENAELRDAVLAARDAFRSAESVYHELRDQHCVRTEACEVPRHIYNRLKPLADAYRAALDNFNCWLNNARESEYAGHIPHSCD